MKNFYKILDNGEADIKLSKNPIDGYTEFEVGYEPNDLETALLSAVEDSEKVTDAKQYLADTDWIAAKLAEYNAGIITEDIKTKYADVFIKREQTREFLRSKGY